MEFYASAAIVTDSGNGELAAALIVNELAIFGNGVVL